MIELTPDDVYAVAAPYLPPGEVAVNEQLHAAALVEADRAQS